MTELRVLVVSLDRLSRAGLEVGMAVPAHVIEEFVARVLAGEPGAGAGEGDAALV